MNLDKILKTTDIVFEDGVPNIQQVTDYIRVMLDKFGDKEPVQNALVQIHAPDTVLVPEADLNKLKATAEDYKGLVANYNNLNMEHNVLIAKYNKLEKTGSDDYEELMVAKLDIKRLEEEKAALKREVEHLNKSKGMCQLDSTGTCTYCDKRVILASRVCGNNNN